MRCAVWIAYFTLFAGGFARAAEQTLSATAGTQASVYAQQEEQLRAILRDNPNDHSALEKTALLAIERGRFREADQAYTRLLELLLPDPATALPVMVCKWHLLQDYAAQASVIRAESEDSLTQGNQRLAEEWLAEVYNPESVIAAIRDQMLDPEYASMLGNLERHWLTVMARFGELESEGTTEEMRQYADSLFGDSPAHSFFALWRGFALIRQKNLEKAEAALNVSALSLADSRTTIDVAVGVNLIREMRRRPLSNEMLNNLSDLIADVSSTIGEQLSETAASLDESFTQAQRLIDARDFDPALEILEAIYPEVANDATRRNRYIFLHAEALWGRQELARANQGFTASALLLRERYAISVAFQRMAEYAAMQDNPDQAAIYAVRSAALLRDQAWKLRETGDFFLRLNLPERAIAYFERSLDLSDSLASDADSFASLAEAYKRIGNRERYLEYAEDYVDTIRQVEELGDEVTALQKGMQHYYQAEIFQEEKKLDDAYREFETASTIITEPFRLSDILMAMANLKARVRETAKAEELAIRVAQLLPDQDYRLRDVGNLFLGLNEPAKALPYFQKALEHGHTLQGKAASYSSLADVYNRLGDPERAQSFARNYIALVTAHREKLTDAEAGLAALYQGEIYNYQGDPRRGYLEYERAARLLEDRYRRSDALLRMAEYQASLGNREQATSLAEASLAEAPGEWWKLRQIGEFFLRQNMPDKAMEYFREAAGLDPDPGMAATYSMVADTYKSMGDVERYKRYMQEYIKAIRADGHTPSPEEEALATYYDGEIKRLDGKADEAFLSYRRASELLKDKERLADVFMLMADYEAEQGERESAADYARRSAEAEPTTDRLRLVGEFLLRVEMPEQALEYFERYARQISSVTGRADVYIIMTENYKRMGDTKRYLAFAQRYADTLAEAEKEGETPPAASRGLAAFYRGEIAASKDERELAYEEYEKASQLITERFRLSEAFMRMAEIKAAQGDSDTAASLAARSADALPDEGWKQQQIANFLLDLNLPLEADRYIQRYAEVSGDARTQATLYASWAESFKQAGNEERYLQFAERFVNLIKAGKITPSPAEQGLAAYFEGELAKAAGDADAAYAAYEKATRLIDDKDRLYEIYTAMAEYQAERGATAEAAELVARSVDGLPPRDYRYRQAAEFVTRLGLPDAAKPYFEAYAGYSADSSNPLVASAALAELYKQQGNTREYLHYAGEYVIAASNDALNLTPNDAGLAEFYRGEILAAEGNRKDALEAYQKAIISLTNHNRLVETLEKMAAIESQLGNQKRATELLERAASLLATEDWNPWRAAELYNKLDMPEKALELFKQQLELAQTPRAKAGAYQALAGIYDQLGDKEGFADAAGKYVELVSSPSFRPTRDENGWRAFYQGRLFSQQQNPDKAFAAFEEASTFFTDTYQKSECYVQMAQIEADRGNNKEAALLMEQAMATVPDNDWRMQQTADMYVRLGMVPEAIELNEQILTRAKTPKAKATIYRPLAEAYKRAGNLDKFAEYAEAYVALTGEADFAATQDEQAWNAFYRGELAARSKEYEQALAAFEESASLFADTYLKSEAYYRMAEIEADRGNDERAAELMEQSLFTIPGNAWRMHQAIDMFARLDKRDDAFRILDAQLTKAVTPKEKAAAYADAADLYKRIGDTDGFLRYAGQYVDLVASNSFEPTREESGRFHVYMAEIEKESKNLNSALEHYHAALPFYDQNRYRQSEIALLMAEIYAQRKDTQKAIEYAEKSVEFTPDIPVRLQAAGNFLLNQNETDRAFGHFYRALELSETDRAKATSYEVIARAYSKLGDKEQYFNYAAEYYNAIDRLGDEATAFDRANQAFFLGEMYTVREDEYQAYHAYARAAELYTDPYLRTEALMPMARYNLKEKNKGLAAEQAREVADLLPDQGWRVADAASILIGSGRKDQAVEVLRRAIDRKPMDNVSLYRDLSFAYIQNKDKRAGLQASENYIDYLYGKVATDNSTDSVQALWDARQNHTNLLKPWGLGLESYQHFVRNEDGSYAINTSHELQKYYYLNRRLRGKMFLNFSDTVHALRKGTFEYDGGTGTWESYQNFGEGGVVGLGFSVEPFFEGVLKDFSLNFEHLRGVGQNSDYKDWRVRAVFDMGDDDKLRPFGTRWHYTKLYSALVYSIKGGDLTSYGTFRKGYTFATGRERHLLIIPYGTITYRYAGKNTAKGERWGSEIGFGISFKQFFRTGRYHLPRADIEYDFYYRVGLTKGMMNLIGLTIATNF